VFESSASKSLGLTPSRGGILPSSPCGGGWRPTGLTTDDLWDVDWGGYRVPLELPFDPDEAHHSDHVLTVDMPLPAWGKNKPRTFNKATRSLGISKDIRERWSRVLATLEEVRAKPRLTPPNVLGLKPSGVNNLSRRDQWGTRLG
jgi:hypothetical protein